MRNRCMEELKAIRQIIQKAMKLSRFENEIFLSLAVPVSISLSSRFISGDDGDIMQPLPRQ